MPPVAVPVARPGSFAALCLLLACVLPDGAGQARAAAPLPVGNGTATYAADAVVAAVGDEVTLQLELQKTSAGGAALSYVYRFDGAAVHVRDSVTRNGLSLPDGDGGVTVYADSLVVTLGVLPLGTTRLVHRVEPRADIGQTVVHRARLWSGASRQLIGAPTTRIEADNVRFTELFPGADATLDQARASYNYGGSATLRVTNTGLSEHRSLLRFDTLDSGMLGTDQLLAAYLELWTPVSASTDMALRAQRVRQGWAEGSLDGAPCFLSGVSWNAPNCLLGWTGGGDLGSTIWANALMPQAEPFAQLNILGLAERWESGADPNDGLAILASTHAASGGVNFSSRSASSSPVPTPRLRLIHGDEDVYEQRAVSSVAAEIVPNEVPIGMAAKRFVYSLAPRLSTKESGLNRIRVAIPSGFSVVSLDSILIDGRKLDPDLDGKLLDGEYQVWSLGQLVDVRAGGTLRDDIDEQLRIDLVFHASTPSIPNEFGVEFVSTVDHDRRGYLWQSAAQGDANDVKEDANSWRVTVTPPRLVAISIQPDSTSLALGDSRQFAAIGRFNDGIERNITSSATWSATSPQLALDVTPGLVRATAVGLGFVGAKQNDIEAPDAPVSVRPAELRALQIAPEEMAIAAGDTARFAAIGTYSDQSQIDHTTGASWGSSDPLVAELVVAGTFVGLQQGHAFALAQLDTIVAEAARIDVSPPRLLALSVSPADTTLALGQAAQVRATGEYSNGQRVDLTTAVEWSSFPSGVVDVGADGAVTTLSQGTTFVLAHLDGIDSFPARFEVTPPSLLRLDGTPDLTTVPSGAAVQLRSFGEFSDASVREVTAEVTWTSLSPALADFTGPGLLHALAAGSVSVTHELDGIVGDTLQVVITSAQLDSITIDPCPARLPSGVELRLTATAHFSDGTSLPLPDDAGWSSTAEAVATIDSSGLLQTLSVGFTSIVAAWQGVDSPSCDLWVDDASLDQLVLAPADTSIALGESVRYRAFGQIDGDRYDFSNSVDWTSTAPAIASVDSTGLAQSQAQGQTNVLAQLGSVVATPASLTVTAPRVVSLRLSPLSSSVSIGRSKQLDALARYSDGSEALVNASATWISSQPSIGFVDDSGLVVGLAVGNASITASLDGIDCTQAAAVAVLPSVTLLALPTGALDSWPGLPDRNLLSLRLSNHYLDARRLQALRVQFPPEGQGRPASNALAELALFADDGDGNFEPAQDTQLSRGQAAAQQWTATNLSLQLGVGESRTFFVTGTPSTLYASHGDTLDAWILNSSAFFFESPTSLVPNGGFPLDSSGFVRVRDLVLAQLQPTTAPVDTVGPGSSGLPVLQIRLPANGGKSDALTQIEVQQLGTARAGFEIERLRLETRSAVAELDKAPPVEMAWVDAGELVHVGNQRFAAASLGIAIASSGLELRVVADIAAGAQLGRSLRLSLPQDGLRFSSGRRGPADAGHVNAQSQIIDVAAELQIAAYPIVTPSVVARNTTSLPLLGLSLSSWSTQPDTLLALRLVQRSTSQAGASSDPDAILERIQLWRDASGDGRVGTDDDLLASTVFAGDELSFLRASGLQLVLEPGIAVRLLVSADVGAAARDGERLALALAGHADLQMSLGLPFDTGEPPRSEWSTPAPPTVDGQDLAGYAIESAPGGVVFAGSQDVHLLSLKLPANGASSDVLEAFEVLQIGSASAADIAALELWRDDGDGSFDADDAKLGALAHAGSSRYRLEALSETLDPGQSNRFHLSLDLPSNPASGGSVRLRLPLLGVEVESGNDGPRDLAYDAPAQFTLAMGDRVTWVAEAVSSAAVAADVQTRPLLVLSEFNGYASPRVLTSMELLEFGSIGDLEIDVWSLHRDEDADGLLDAGEAPIAVATQVGSSVRFDGFAAALAPLAQARFFVAYSLASLQARDGATIDLRVPDSASLGYENTGATLSSGEFPLDSPGNDSVDGLYARQVRNHPLGSRSLGGLERDVLSLDLVIPSNGFESDVLTGLSVELVGSPSAVLGPDLSALRLYRELDAEPTQASFDPAEDILLGSLLSPDLPLRFAGFSASLPVGGRRFYVACDVAANPAPGRQIALRVPVGGIELASSNDGPLDAGIEAQALHTISDSPLLLQVDTQPRLLSRGQEVDVLLLVSNRGDSTLSDVGVAQLPPPAGAVWIFGPTPSSLQLLPGEADSMFVRFRLDAPGSLRFVAQVADGTAASALVEGPLVLVEEPPSALSLQTLSNLPLSINRGTVGVIPMSWRLQHPDASGSAADIEIRRLEFTVEDGAGPLPADQVLRRVRLRTQGQELASIDPVGASANVVLDLVPPLRLSAGEQRELPLEVDIASDASAGAFRLRIVDATAVTAVDVHGGQAVALLADLPWNTPTALLRTAATHVDLGLLAALPAHANRGQGEVPAGRLHFAVPGVPGQSEVRVLEVALQLRDGDALPVDPATILSAVRVRSATQSLLELQPMPDASGLLRLPLSLPKVVVSGAPEILDVFVDFNTSAQIDSLFVGVADSSLYVARDLNSGAVLPALCQFQSPYVFEQGPLGIQAPASAPFLDFSDQTIGIASAGEAALRLAEFELTHVGGPSEADLLWNRLLIRLVDERSATLVPASLANAIRLYDESGTLLATLAPPASATPIVFELAGSPRLAPGATLCHRVELDLRSDIAEDWLRLALDVGGIEVADANDAASSLAPYGDVPAATQLVRIVAPARALALGVVAPPPSNLVAGSADQAVLPLRLRHGGESNEGDVAVDSVSLRLLGPDGSSVPAAELVAGARLSVGDSLFAGTLDGGSLRFALSGWLVLSPSESAELLLRLDLVGSPSLADFHLSLHASDVRAGGGAALAIEGDGFSLPYVSPSIHVLAGDFAATFSSYPNPFAAGREAAQIVFVLERPAQVSAEIFTLDGRLVRRLASDVALAAGMQEFTRWDGRNGDGELVRNGTYLLRLSVDGQGGGSYLRKVTVLR